ncbi:MAG TPA: response regulator [Candidatus Acidoferrales bacterium]|jgi:two-component system response regulator|nr:response regulator [Candidatus Acidoferrales bacterium]
MNSETLDILLVEDSEDDSAFFIDALKESNPAAQLRVARDGVEALTLMFGAGNPADAMPIVRPKLIILDLKLPKVSGVEVLRQLKGNPHTRAIPVVTLSSSREKRDLAECYQLGANSYLMKPMDFDEFGNVVRILGQYWLQFNQPPKS